VFVVGEGGGKQRDGSCEGLNLRGTDLLMEVKQIGLNSFKYLGNVNSTFVFFITLAESGKLAMKKNTAACILIAFVFQSPKPRFFHIFF